MKLIENLWLPNGSEPFMEWYEALELSERYAIRSFIDRVAMGGSKKNVKSLGDGVFEIKIDRGPGYRVYFGEIGLVTILILCGGTKRGQDSDIALAKQYWSTYVPK